MNKLEKIFDVNNKETNLMENYKMVSKLMNPDFDYMLDYITETDLHKGIEVGKLIGIRGVNSNHTSSIELIADITLENIVIVDYPPNPLIPNVHTNTFVNPPKPLPLYYRYKKKQNKKLKKLEKLSKAKDNNV